MKLTVVTLLLSACLVVGQTLPTVAVLSTGGTIASKQDPTKGGYITTLSGKDLVSAVPAIQKIAQIQVEQISNIPSQDINPDISVRLATRVNDLLGQPEIAGIVITHGRLLPRSHNHKLKARHTGRGATPSLLIQIQMAGETCWTPFESLLTRRLSARESWLS
jgi:hypothetical protein